MFKIREVNSGDFVKFDGIDWDGDAVNNVSFCSEYPDAHGWDDEVDAENVVDALRQYAEDEDKDYEFEIEDENGESTGY